MSLQPSGEPSATVPDAPVLLTEVADRIGVITLNRPATRNALNGELMAALDGAVRAMAADNDVKVVILTGAAPEGGHGGFCSGGDVKDGGRGAPGSELGVPADALDGDLSRHDLHAAMLLHLMPKPTIAMVGGPAVGAGCSLAAACDLRFASSDAVSRRTSPPTDCPVMTAARSSGPGSAERPWPGGCTCSTRSCRPTAPSSSAWCTRCYRRSSCLSSRWTSPAAWCERPPPCLNWSRTT